MSIMETKTVTLGDFCGADTEVLCEIVHDTLQEMGINPASFAFSIEVDYTEDGDED
jgi:hypothetical protein